MSDRSASISEKRVAKSVLRDFDGFFLGRIGTNALAGASLAFPWVMLVLQTTNSGMGSGVSSAHLAPGAGIAPTISSSTPLCWR